MSDTKGTEVRSSDPGPLPAKREPRQAQVDRNVLPKDRYDAVERSGRVGAHRIVGSPRRFWMYFVSALVGVALLTGAGIVFIQFSGASISSFTSGEQQPRKVEPKVTPELAPDAPVVVLNGTSMPGFGAIIDGIITANGWGKILFSAEAASDEVEISAVFYTSVADEAAALALANELGGVSTFQSYDYTDYGAKLVVLLGADYGGPGSDQFVPVESEPEADAAE